jgi:hypothetical protein
MASKPTKKLHRTVILTGIFVICISNGCSSSPRNDRSPAMSPARRGGSSDIWINPNVPTRLPIIQPSNYPKWTDTGAMLTPGTPASCDPHVFIPQFAKGNALDDYFSSNEDDRDPSRQLKDFFNGHPIRFPSGKILFPVGVGKVKASDGSHASRLEDLFFYEKKKSATNEDSGAEQFCTTYLNEGNKDAQANFQWIFIPVADKGKTTDPARVAEASKIYNDTFNQLIERLVDCEGKFGYYAFGCQSAFERTPTILGMILKELGCSTENSVFIADMLLGRNDIPLETRQMIVDQTPINSALQKKLQQMLWATPDSP